MTTRIKISDALYNKFHFVTKYASSCGYTFIDEFKATDFIAMRASYGLTSSEIQEVKNYINSKMYNSKLGIADNVIKITNNTMDKPLNQKIIPFVSDNKKMTDHSKSDNEKYYKAESELEAEDSSNSKLSHGISSDLIDEEDDALSKVHNLSNDLLQQRVKSKSLSISDNVDSIGFTVRAVNALKAAGINAVNEVLDLTEEKLYEMRNVGKKTVNEILNAISILKNIDFDETSSSSLLGKRQFKLRKEFKDHIYSIIHSEMNFGIEDDKYLSEEERELAIAISNSLNILNREIAVMAYDNPIGSKSLLLGFEDFILKTERSFEIIRELKKIPQSRLKNQLHSYLKAFKMDNIKSVLELINPSFLSEIFDAESEEISFMVEDLIILLRKSCISRNAAKLLAGLIEHLNYNMIIDLQQIISKYKYEHQREFYVLTRRVNGETLEVIAKDMKLTRERVRQMELKTLKKFSKMLYAGKDPLMLISADFADDKILTKEEIIDYFGDSFTANVFVSVVSLKDAPNKYFTYDKNINAFKFIDNKNTKAIDFSFLPDMIFDDELMGVLEQLSTRNNIPFEEAKIRFENLKYKRIGRAYCIGRLTNEKMYGYVLRSFYPSGIKLYDAKETHYFCEKVGRIFGDIELPSNRAVDAAVAKMSILYDRGMYIHPSYVHIQDSVINEIDLFLQSADRSAISFNELFEKFKEKLLLCSNIHNRYFLQGVLKDRLSSKYYFSRDYISKEQQFSIGDDIEVFIKESGRVNKNQLFEKFAGITEIVMSMKIADNKNIISFDNGEYIYSDLLNILEEDYNIGSFILSKIADYPITSRKLLTEMLQYYPDFLIRNNINTHCELFGVMRFMFDDKFKFSRPYIAKIDSGELSNLKVLNQYLKDYDTITLEELMYLCNETHIVVTSWHNTIRNLNTDFLRIDAYNLSRFEEEIFDDEIMQSICLRINEIINAKGFAVGQKICDFMLYPDTGFEWNPFLLRSIVEKYLSDQFEMIEMPTSDSYAMGTIFVNSDIEAENYVQLLKSILKNEHYREPFRSATEIIAWLKQEGLFLGEPPKCLSDGQVFSVNEYGSISL